MDSVKPLAMVPMDFFKTAVDKTVFASGKSGTRQSLKSKFSRGSSAGIIAPRIIRGSSAGTVVPIIGASAECPAEIEECVNKNIEIGPVALDGFDGLDGLLEDPDGLDHPEKTRYM